MKLYGGRNIDEISNLYSSVRKDILSKETNKILRWGHWAYYYLTSPPSAYPLTPQIESCLLQQRRQKQKGYLLSVIEQV